MKYFRTQRDRNKIIIKKLIKGVVVLIVTFIVLYQIQCHFAYSDYNTSEDGTEEVEELSAIGKILEGTHPVREFDISTNEVHGKLLNVTWQLHNGSWSINSFKMGDVRVEFQSDIDPQIRFRWKPSGISTYRPTGNMQKDLDKFMIYTLLICKEEDWDANGTDGTTTN